MEVNNNTEINKMFGDESQSETKNESGNTVNASPFQDASPAPLASAGLSGASPDFSGGAGSGNSDSSGAQGGGLSNYMNDTPDEHRGDSFVDDGTVIGDHSGFHLAGGGGGIGAKTLLIVVPLTLIIGIAGGIFACYVYFFGLHVSAEEKAAQTAMSFIREALEVDEQIEKIIFTEIFVNNKTSAYDCIVFATVEDKSVTFTNEVFHIIIPKDSGEKSMTNGNFNQELYAYIREYGNEQERIQAEIDLGKHLEFERVMNEILGGNKDFKRVNPFFLNVKMDKSKI
jgi:hypothetical protein